MSSCNPDALLYLDVHLTTDDGWLQDAAFLGNVGAFGPTLVMWADLDQWTGPPLPEAAHVPSEGEQRDRDSLFIDPPLSGCMYREQSWIEPITTDAWGGTVVRTTVAEI